MLVLLIFLWFPLHFRLYPNDNVHFSILYTYIATFWRNFLSFEKDKRFHSHILYWYTKSSRHISGTWYKFQNTHTHTQVYTRNFVKHKNIKPWHKLYLSVNILYDTTTKVYLHGKYFLMLNKKYNTETHKISKLSSPIPPPPAPQSLSYKSPTHYLQYTIII